MNRQQKNRLATLVSARIFEDCPLAAYTSYGIGGPAEILIELEKRRELASLLAFLDVEDIPWRILGKGTNLLIRDEGLAGVSLLLGGEFLDYSLLEIEDGRLLRAGAGCLFSRICRQMCDKGYSGLEFGVGIPGTLGGGVVMNAGAWGSEISEIIERIVLVSAAGETILHREELSFSYRCWQDFADYKSGFVVSEVDMALCRGERQEILSFLDSLTAKRRERQPRGRSCGSFFKNPPGSSAGWLIESAGLKGVSVGAALVSGQHANFLVNQGGATAQDVLLLMKIVQGKVLEESGIVLEPEVHIL